MREEKKYWIWMASLPGMGAKTFYQILKSFGSAANFFDAVDKKSAQINDISPEIIQSARAGCSVSRIAEIICKLEEKGVAAITRLCGDYPQQLACIPWPPAVLFVKGKLLSVQRSIAIVGTRRCSRRGFELTRKIAGELGMPVVSGLARGIDTAAHKGALEAKQTTIAVLGCGADVVYPPENTGVYNDIIQNDGAIITELPIGAVPLAANFPVRNRIIAGLARGLLVVESEEAGGTAITVSKAICYGKEIFAVPGPPNAHNSVLPNLLIANGAVPVCTALDIINHFGEVSNTVNSNELPQTLDFLQSRILELLKIEDKSAQALAECTGLPADEINVALTMLELSGAVSKVDGTRYGL